jgi:hypothetical protein
LAKACVSDVAHMDTKLPYPDDATKVTKKVVLAGGPCFYFFPEQELTNNNAELGGHINKNCNAEHDLILSNIACTK